VRFAIISAERGTEALTDLVDFPLTRYPHFVLLTRIWQLRHLTAYDAAYLALAEALDATLVTRDRALAKAGNQVRVEVIQGKWHRSTPE
jgi:predicted nucleic acid-binding protein